MVQRMVGPTALSASRLARRVGIAQPTLSKWLRDAQGNIGPVKFDSPPPPPANPRRPEDWSPEERLQAVLEASRLKDVSGFPNPRNSGAEKWLSGALFGAKDAWLGAELVSANRNQLRFVERGRRPGLVARDRFGRASISGWRA